MFRKIVTELAYSPALAGSLGVYIRRLRDERSRRQIGLIFVTLAVAVQLLSTLLPPESANANDPAVFIDGGISSIEDYLDYYDQNTQNARDLLSSLGIARSDIEAARLSSSSDIDKPVYWSTANNRSSSNSAYSFQTPSGKLALAYYQPVTLNAPQSEAYYGISSKNQSKFAIVKQSGNLITDQAGLSDCNPWFSTATNSQPSDSRDSALTCPDTLSASLAARTISSSSSSSAPDSASNSDRIRYTLLLKNTGGADTPVLPAINLEDALEYSRILDNGGGSYDFDTKMLSWPTTTLSPGQELERNFTMQILPTTPSTASGEFVAASYDCKLQITFGNSLSIPVDCPLVKHIELLSNRLPVTASWVNLTFAPTLMVITLFLYARSRQLLTELYIIRHNHLGGL